jgi:protein-disulfide isomerase
MRKGVKTIVTIAGILLLSLSIPFHSHAQRPGVRANLAPATRARILTYIRERFGVPTALKLTINSIQPSAYPPYLESSVTVDDGKEKRNQIIFLSTDYRLLIVGQIFNLGTDPRADIERDVRQLFKLPEGTTVAVGSSRRSSFPGLLTITITVAKGQQKQSQDYYVTADNRRLILGNVFNLATDPREEARRIISTRNQPSLGSANAPVTVVEYADLECPMCARVHEFLEKELLPRYGNKVRVIFKEFPLVAIHEWSLTAAIANQCVFEMKPEAYAPYRSLIFQNQGLFTAANVRDLLLTFGEQVGVDRVRLAACLDAKASLPRVEQGAEEGKRLNILSTPTSFINGRIMIGLPSADAYFQVVDEALRTAK